MQERRSKEPQSWAAHVRATVVLALPLVGTQMAQMAMGVTDTLMLGWLGAAELAGSILGTQAFFIFYIFGVGFSLAAMPLAAAAEGAGEAAGVRRVVRMGLWVLALYSALVMWPLWHTERILLALGQDSEIAGLAGDYVRVAMWSMLPALMVSGMRAFLTVVGHAYLMLAVIAAGAVVNGVLNYSPDLRALRLSGAGGRRLGAGDLDRQPADGAHPRRLRHAGAGARALRDPRPLLAAGLGELRRDPAARLADRGDDHRRGRLSS